MKPAQYVVQLHHFKTQLFKNPLFSPPLSPQGLESCLKGPDYCNSQVLIEATVIALTKLQPLLSKVHCRRSLVTSRLPSLFLSHENWNYPYTAMITFWKTCCCKIFLSFWWIVFGSHWLPANGRLVRGHFDLEENKNCWRNDADLTRSGSIVARFCHLSGVPHAQSSVLGGGRRSSAGRGQPLLSRNCAAGTKPPHFGHHAGL